MKFVYEVENRRKLIIHTVFFVLYSMTISGLAQGTRSAEPGSAYNPYVYKNAPYVSVDSVRAVGRYVRAKEVQSMATLQSESSACNTTAGQTPLSPSKPVARAASVAGPHCSADEVQAIGLRLQQGDVTAMNALMQCGHASQPNVATAPMTVGQLPTVMKALIGPSLAAGNGTTASGEPTSVCLTRAYEKNQSDLNAMFREWSDDAAVAALDACEHDRTAPTFMMPSCYIYPKSVGGMGLPGGKVNVVSPRGPYADKIVPYSEALQAIGLPEESAWVKSVSD